MPRVQMPDGQVVNVPTGADPDEIVTAYMSDKQMAPTTPPDPGFFPTLGRDIKDGFETLSSALGMNPGGLANQVRGTAQGMQRAAESFRAGNPEQGLSRAGQVVPGIAPIFQGGEEITNGQPRAGMAHMLEGVAPLVAPALARYGPTAARVGVGAVKGGIQALPESLKYARDAAVPSYVLDQIGGHGTGKIAEGVAAGIPIAKGAIRGGRAALSAERLRNAPPPVTESISSGEFRVGPPALTQVGEPISSGEFRTRSAAPPTQPPPLPPPSVTPSSGSAVPFTHSAYDRMTQNITNKVHNIADYLFSNGIHPEVLDMMTPEQRAAAAQAAWEHGRGKGATIPKSAYKGLEGDTLKLVQQELQKRHAAGQ